MPGKKSLIVPLKRVYFILDSLNELLNRFKFDKSLIPSYNKEYLSAIDDFNREVPWCKIEKSKLEQELMAIPEKLSSRKEVEVC